MNDGLTGMVPIALKELTELQGLHLSGTALTGSLSPVFCMGGFNIPKFEADCADQTEVQCSCCTACCGRIDDEPHRCGQNTFAPTPESTLAPTPDRRNEVEKIISSEIPSFQLGPSQIKALNWLAHDDPANLDFELVSPDELLERFVMALLYFSTGGENWADPFSTGGENWAESIGLLSNTSVCSWNEYSDNLFHSGVLCDPMVVEIRFSQKKLSGQLPTELGLLTTLQELHICKFATASSSEFFDTIALFGIVLQSISSTVVEDWNDLTGPIPSELGLLTGLDTLRLGKFVIVANSELDTIILFGSVSQFISFTIL
jgi:hypothetical protein